VRDGGRSQLLGRGAHCGESVPPCFGPELLGPGVEAGSASPRPLDHVTQLLSPTGKGGLKVALVDIVKGQAEAGPAQPGAKQFLPATESGPLGHPRPLKGRERLGDEIVDADVDLQTAGPSAEHLASQLAYAQTQIRDGKHVVVFFKGKPDHEIQLEGRPPGSEGLGHCSRHVLIGDVLVDHISQPLATGLRSQGQGRTGGRYQAGQPHRRAVHPQRRQGDAHLGVIPGRPFQESLDAGVVGGGERGEGEFLMAAHAQLGLGHLHDLIRRPLPYRAVPHARLAKPAAPGTAPHDLDPSPVVHTGRQRHQDRVRIRRPRQSSDRAAPHALAQTGHEHPLDPAQPPFGLLSRPPPLSRKDQRGQYLGKHLLSVADGDRVQEAGERKEIG